MTDNEHKLTESLRDSTDTLEYMLGLLQTDALLWNTFVRSSIQDSKIEETIRLNRDLLRELGKKNNP